MREDPPTLESLLTHGDFVRALARGLLGRDDRVEDVVQETWLAAMRSPPRHGASPRGWLARVARNAALRLRQRETRRPRVEAHAGLPAAAPTPDEVLEREAVRQRVVRALLGLPETDREALLLRYYEDLPPRAVAQRLGLPVETVRTRIRRALARLRQALEREPGPAWRTWAVAALPGPAAHAASVLTLLLGVLTMKKVLATGTAVALVLLAGWWVAHETGFLTRSDSASEEFALVGEPGGSLQATDENGPKLEGVAESDAPERTRAPYGIVHGRVVDTAGRAIAGARIWIGSTRAPRWVARLYAGEYHTLSDHEGRFRFTPKAPVDRVHASADGCAGRGGYWHGGDAPVEFVLRRTDLVVRGTIRDLAGRPISDARVVIFSPYGAQPGTWGRSGADGHYEIPFVSGCETYVCAWAPRFLEVQAGIPRLSTDAPEGVDLVLRPGYWIQGRVTDAETGEGIRGAVLTAYERFGPVPRTDADGRFLALATREANEIRASAEGYRDEKTWLTFEEGAARADLSLQPLTAYALEGVVLDDGGVPVSDAHVRTPRGAHAFTDSEGRFRLSGWAPPEGGPVALIAEAGDAAPAVVLDPSPGEAVTLRLGPPTFLAGRVRLPGGEPAPGSSVRLRSDEGAAIPLAIFEALSCAKPRAVSADGIFRIGGLPPGEVEVEARPARDANALPATVRVAVPHEDALEITLPSACILRGRVIDADGRGLPFAELGFSGGARRPSVTADAEGRFRVPGFAPGRVNLHVRAPGYQPWTREFTLVDEALEVRLVPSPWICFRLQGEVPPGGSSVYVSAREPGSASGRGGSNQVLDGVVWHELGRIDRTLEYVVSGNGWTTRPVVIGRPDGVHEVEVEVIGVTAPEQAPPEPTEPPVEAGTIAGRVRRWVGDLEGDLARVGTFVHARRETEARARTEQSAHVQADGTFCFDEVPAGRWLLHLQRGFRSGEAVRVEVVAGRTVEVDDLEALAYGPSIRGVVLDDEDEPVEGVSVWALSEGPYARPGIAETDGDGAVEIGDLEEGKGYRLDSHDERGQVDETLVEAGHDPVTVRFVRHGTLRGFLSGPWGAEVPSEGRVSFCGAGPANLRTSAHVQAGGLEPYFERRLPAGEYLVTAQLGDFVTASAQTVTVRSGEVSPRLDLVLVRGGIVHVRLIDPKGAPQRGGLLRLPEAWGKGRYLEPRDGSYSIREVPPGRWTLEVQGSCGRGDVTFSIAVGETLELEIVLRP